MLKFYHIYFTTYHNKTKISEYYGYTCKEEISQQYEKINITWDNLEEMYNRYHCFLAFRRDYSKRKGRSVVFFGSYSNYRVSPKDFKTIYEKKEKNLNITLTICTKEDNPSIEKVLKYGNGKQAIQYLTERGLLVIK